ncbi:MAG: tryptophan-rich sensory protein [Alphaproteobacteria bacterium]|nr:tryptophan-rich sensory protein [Alphaproteobacteria bacterium]
MKKIWLFILTMVISFAPGLIGIIFTPMGHQDAWFNDLLQSGLTPPPMVFSIAWTVLYALLGIALFMIVKRPIASQRKTKSYLLFAAQMALNVLWSYVFFGLHMATAGLFIVVLLLFIAMWLERAFRCISTTASILTWPYILWLMFAAYLNMMIVYMN